MLHRILHSCLHNVLHRRRLERGWEDGTLRKEEGTRKKAEGRETCVHAWFQGGLGEGGGLHLLCIAFEHPICCEQEKLKEKEGEGRMRKKKR